MTSFCFRFADPIACHADNGYGTPMHAQRSVQISRAPVITVALGGDSSNRPSDVETPVRKAYAGTDLLLLCRVDAFPSPTISVGKNGEGIVQSDRVQIEMNSTEFKEDELGRDSTELVKWHLIPQTHFLVSTGWSIPLFTITICCSMSLH